MASSRSLCFCPGDGIGVSEITVFGVGPIHFEARQQTAGGEIAARSDIVSGEEMDGSSGSGDAFGHTKLSVRIDCSGARFFNMGAGNLRAFRDIIPNKGRQGFEQIREQGFSAFFVIGATRRWQQHGSQ